MTLANGLTREEFISHLTDKIKDIDLNRLYNVIEEMKLAKFVNKSLMYDIIIDRYNDNTVPEYLKTVTAAQFINLFVDCIMLRFHEYEKLNKIIDDEFKTIFSDNTTLNYAIEIIEQDELLYNYAKKTPVNMIGNMNMSLSTTTNYTDGSKMDHTIWGKFENINVGNFVAKVSSEVMKYINTHYEKAGKYIFYFNVDDHLHKLIFIKGETKIKIEIENSKKNICVIL